MTTALAYTVQERQLINLFYQVELDLEAARKMRFQPTHWKTLADSMKATAAAHARQRHAVDMAFDAGLDARSLMDAAHLQFIENNYN